MELFDYYEYGIKIKTVDKKALIEIIKSYSCNVEWCLNELRKNKPVGMSYATVIRKPQ